MLKKLEGLINKNNKTNEAKIDEAMLMIDEPAEASPPMSEKDTAIQTAQELYAVMQEASADQVMGWWTMLSDDLNKANVGYEVLDPSLPSAEAVEQELVNRVHKSYLRRIKASYGWFMETRQETELEKIRFGKSGDHQTPLKKKESMEDDFKKIGVTYEILREPGSDKTAEEIEETITQACEEIENADRVAKARGAYLTFCDAGTWRMMLAAYDKFSDKMDDVSYGFEKIFPPDSELRKKLLTKDSIREFCTSLCIERANKYFYDALLEYDDPNKVRTLFCDVERAFDQNFIKTTGGNPIDPSRSRDEIIKEAEAIVIRNVKEKNLLCNKKRLEALRPNAMKRSGPQKSLEQ